MKNKLDLNAMLTFCKVAENKSFTAAAEGLGVKKSTVSNKISDLERSLGAKLLYRNTRHVALTEIGEDYYNYCREIVNKAEEANQFVTTFNNKPQGTLRIIAPPGMSRVLFDDLFDYFLKSHEMIKIDVTLTLEYVDIIKEGYDVALIVANEKLKDSSLIARKLYDVDLGFFATPQYLADNSKINDLNDLEDHPIIQSLGTKPAIYSAGKHCTYTMNNRIVINYLDASIKAVMKDLGIGMFPSDAVIRELENKELVRVLDDYDVAPSSIYVVYHSRSWLAPKLKAFLEFLDNWRDKKMATEKALKLNKAV
ncbi:MAG: hypothetical protein CMP91_12105 [Gammaproteobacteria bacterium]|nr:hypothetical protein [Gammaproteobacteria bacterium]|tara:strand:- start:197 stop:1126 length:930 start_codon:yes stop_codon:yes gene_type:complete